MDVWCILLWMYASMKRWSKKEINILTKYYLNWDIDKLQAYLPNRTKGAIQRKASFLGLTDFFVKQSQSQRKYIWNTSFFSNINKINSYWAGFIAADGHLDNRDKGIKIHIHKKDIELLQRFKNDIEWTGPIKTPASSQYCRIDIWGAHEAHLDLKNNWNINSGNKTLSLRPPNLKNIEHRLSYILGLYDGDGGIAGKYGVRLCGALSVMKWVSCELGNICGYYPKPKLNGKSKVNYCILWNRKQFYVMLHNTFNNLGITQRLKRKIKKYE